MQILFLPTQKCLTVSSLLSGLFFVVIYNYWKGQGQNLKLCKLKNLFSKHSVLRESCPMFAMSREHISELKKEV